MEVIVLTDKRFDATPKSKTTVVRAHPRRLKRGSAAWVREHLRKHPGGWTPVMWNNDLKRSVRGKKLTIDGKKYEVSLRDRFVILDQELHKETDPILAGTGVKFTLGTPPKETMKVDGRKIHRWASGLDYADSFGDEATIIEIVWNKPIDEIKKMETKDGKNLYDAAINANGKAIERVFGRQHIEWETDWDDTNRYEWGLMKNPWHPQELYGGDPY